MQRPFFLTSRHKDKAVVRWATRSFAGGSTFRMFGKNQSSKIREFLEHRIGNCSSLADARSSQEYDDVICSLVEKFRSSGIRMNRNSKNRAKRPKFGQAAKVINLYIKQYALRPEFMGKRKALLAQRMIQYAHVPLDGIVLEHVWNDFEKQLCAKNIKRPPKLSTLKRVHYLKIQKVIAEEAKKQDLPPLAYDFKWTER